MKYYFEGCRTAEDLKKAYRGWAKRLHPDVGGDAEEFKAMQASFESEWARLKDIHRDREGNEYYKETTETAGEFMEIIEELLKLDGVEVEICGSWIWCSGDTRPHCDTLKRLRFRWSRLKSAWYFHNEPYRKRNGRELTLDEIRDMYGSTRYRRGDEDDGLVLQA